MGYSDIMGKRAPDAVLGRLTFGQVERVSLEEMLSGRRAIIIGVPGAFTPVCTRQHVPDFVRQAETFRARRYDLLICIAANDPFTIDAWSESLDPSGQIIFLSDGNLEFAGRLGVRVDAPDLFMGRRASRYLLTTDNVVVTRFAVEREPLALTCTRASDILLDEPQPVPAFRPPAAPAIHPARTYARGASSH